MKENGQQFIAFAGFRGEVPDVQALLGQLREVEEETGFRLQVMDAGLVYGREHLTAAFAAAVRARSTGKGRASELKTEFVRYAAGGWQIGEALKMMGVGKGGGDQENIAAALWTAELDEAVSSGDGAGITGTYPGMLEEDRVNAALGKVVAVTGFVRDDPVLDGDDGVLNSLGIGHDERELVGVKNHLGLVLEKVAMADLRK
jgi:tRNA threonylcarbamoyladenosine modification (KEOPS) complex Cgi121 subunit